MKNPERVQRKLKRRKLVASLRRGRRTFHPTYQRILEFFKVESVVNFDDIRAACMKTIADDIISVQPMGKGEFEAWRDKRIADGLPVWGFSIRHANGEEEVLYKPENWGDTGSGEAKD